MGEYSDNGICKKCPENTYSTTASSTYCTDCPAGTFSVAGSSECVSKTCPPGEAVNSDGNSLTCSKLPECPMHSTRIPGSISRDIRTACKCDVSGYQLITSTSNGSISCVAPCPGAKNDCETCTVCPANTFALGSSRNFKDKDDSVGFCPNLKNGRFQTYTEVRGMCMQCLPGILSDPGTIGGCTKCPPGENLGRDPDTSFPKCIPCTAGTYSPDGKTACVVCPANTYAAVSSGATKCEPCPAGQFSSPGWTYCNATGR